MSVVNPSAAATVERRITPPNTAIDQPSSQPVSVSVPDSLSQIPNGSWNLLTCKEFPFEKEYLQLFAKEDFPHLIKRLDDQAPVLIMNDQYRSYIQRKKQINEQHYNKVVAIPQDKREEIKNPANEILEEIINSSAGKFIRTGNEIRNTITNDIFDLDSEHPLEIAAKLIQEDITLMDMRSAVPVLVAGTVHFPSYWSIADKVGRTLAGVHYTENEGMIDGVPMGSYKIPLENHVNKFFVNGMKSGSKFLRYTVSIYKGDELTYIPGITPRPQIPTDLEEFANSMFIRFERQVFLRLKNNPDYAAMFIHPVTIPLRRVETNPELARDLFKMHSKMTEEHRQYRNITFMEPLMQYLQSVVETPLI